MPESNRFVGSSIEEFLVSLANGVREAQLALNSGPMLDASGRLLPTYHLPYLDFTLQVDMQSHTDGGRPILLLRTVRAAQLVSAGSTRTEQHISSTINGRLVATPPGDGLPVPHIHLSISKRNANEVLLAIAATNSAGETLVGQRIELNVDDAETQALSPPNFQRSADTRLADAVLTTDEGGRSQAELQIAAADRIPGAIVSIVASMGAFDARISVPLMDGER